MRQIYTSRVQTTTEKKIRQIVWHHHPAPNWPSFKSCHNKTKSEKKVHSVKGGFLLFAESSFSPELSRWPRIRHVAVIHHSALPPGPQWIIIISGGEFPILRRHRFYKVEQILRGSLDSIPSPLPTMKIQIMGRKVSLRFKGKTLLGVVNKLLKTKCLLTSPSNVLPYHLK